MRAYFSNAGQEKHGASAMHYSSSFIVSFSLLCVTIKETSSNVTEISWHLSFLTSLSPIPTRFANYPHPFAGVPPVVLSRIKNYAFPAGLLARSQKFLVSYAFMLNLEYSMSVSGFFISNVCILNTVQLYFCAYLF